MATGNATENARAFANEMGVVSAGDVAHADSFAAAMGLATSGSNKNDQTALAEPLYASEQLAAKQTFCNKFGALRYGEQWGRIEQGSPLLSCARNCGQWRVADSPWRFYYIALSTGKMRIGKHKSKTNMTNREK